MARIRRRREGKERSLSPYSSLGGPFDIGFDIDNIKLEVENFFSDPKDTTIFLYY